MVAPNGARRTHEHHPNIPLTDDALINAVTECHRAGADGAHLHIRDENSVHLLDADRYRRLLERLQKVVPDMYLQVTSEAAGIYEAPEQQAMVQALKPQYVSVAMREMVRNPNDWAQATHFYSWADNNNVNIQHILYSTDELKSFLSAIAAGSIPGTHHFLQFVLGNYDGTSVSKPSQVSEFTKLLGAAPDGLSFDWMLCAFGKEETVCLVEALQQGGKARIGFENSLWNADGSLAKSNEERVIELVAQLK